MGVDGSIRTLVWLRSGQAAIVRSVAERASLRVTHAGWWEGGSSSEPFEGASPFSDLRQALAAAEVDLFLLAAPLAQGKGAQPDLEEELLDMLGERGVPTVTLEPLPSAASLADERPSAWRAPVFVPLLRESPVVQSALEALDHIGTPRTLSVSMRCGGSHASLGARLFDAAVLVQSLLGEPDAVDACVVTPVAASGVHEAPSETLARLRGDLTANVRYAGARAASLSLSDRAGRWFRGFTLIGEKGCLRLDDHGFDITDHEGRLVDSSRPNEDGAGALDPAAEAIGDAVARSIDRAAPKSGPLDHASVLSIAEAALLSARTGQGESPGTIRRMARST